MNPAHLEAVTSRENTLRGTTGPAVNAAKTHCPRGHEYDIVTPRGWRRCRECRRIQAGERNERLRQR